MGVRCRYALRMLGCWLDVLATGVLAAPRVAVFGGSGYLGSRVCKVLTEAGCSVVSISRMGKPLFAQEESWHESVAWHSADALSAERFPLGRIDAAVSCVGNMRPSPQWKDFFGLNWDYQTMVLENGVVNGRIAEAAKRAGAVRFVYVSTSSVMKFAYGGALEGYIDGKEGAEAAARACFGDERTCVIGPSLILGGGRLDGFARAYASACDSGGVRGAIKLWKTFKVRV